MSTNDASEGARIEARDGVLRITFDRPSRRNSLDQATVRRIVSGLESAATDDTLRVVVLAGNGDHFCAGADWVASNAANVRPRTGSLQRRTPLQAHRLVELLATIQLPVVCSVRGWAAGLGLVASPQRPVAMAGWLADTAATRARSRCVSTVTLRGDSLARMTRCPAVVVKTGNRVATASISTCKDSARTARRRT